MPLDLSHGLLPQRRCASTEAGSLLARFGRSEVFTRKYMVQAGYAWLRGEKVFATWVGRNLHQKALCASGTHSTGHPNDRRLGPFGLWV